MQNLRRPPFPVNLELLLLLLLPLLYNFLAHFLLLLHTAAAVYGNDNGIERAHISYVRASPPLPSISICSFVDPFWAAEPENGSRLSGLAAWLTLSLSLSLSLSFSLSRSLAGC